MKEGWTYKKLGEVCTVINGLWTGKKEPFVNIAVIRNTNFSKDCKLKLDDIAYIDVEAKQFATRKLEYGDIIVEKSGGSEKQPVGRAVLFDIIEGDYSFSNFTATIRINDKGAMLPKFLNDCLYWHYQNGDTVKMQSKTTGLHNLDMKAFLRQPIPLPPLSEQERIVSELDLLTEVIDKQKAQLKELDTLAQSIFYDMFGDPVLNDKGWEKKKLGEVCVLLNGYAFKSEEYVEEGIRVLRITNVQKARIEDNDPKYFPESREQEIKKFLLYEGDLLISLTGNVGRVGILPASLLPAALNQRVACLRPCSHEVDSMFLFHFLNSDSFENDCIYNAAGIAQKNMSTKWLQEYSIPLPPLSLQQSFADKVSAIEQQKAAIGRSIAETQQLFDYTMDKYFG